MYRYILCIYTIECLSNLLIGMSVSLFRIVLNTELDRLAKSKRLSKFTDGADYPFVYRVIILPAFSLTN
jgi:hypothetical protein